MRQTLLVAFALVVSLAACDDLSASALSLPSGVKVVWTQKDPPEGAGASPQRSFVLAGEAPSDEDLLTRVADHLARRGWRAVRCVTTVERCFTHGHRFVALAPADRAPEGYPARRGGGPEVLAVLE